MAARRGGRGGGGGQKRPWDDLDQGYNPQTFTSSSAEDKEPINETKREAFLDEQQFSKNTEAFIAFDSKFVQAMLSNVKVLTIGDSLMRGLYKDLITWLKSDNLIDDRDIKARAEPSYNGDRQIDVSLLTDDKVFRQAREFQTEEFLIQFLFTTRVMKDDMEMVIQQMMGEDGYPDVILLNSMIWDLTRYFKVSTDTSFSDSQYQKEIEIEALQKYLDRTSMLLRRLRAVLPPHTIVLWICFPHCRPSIDMRGRGMQSAPLTSERNHFIRSVMIDGSFRVAQLVRTAGFDVLDIGFYMRNHAFYHYQKDDGMHWLPSGVRLMSQLVLQFLAKSWGIDTTSYLMRLERRLAGSALDCALDQFDMHNYYAQDIPNMHDEIAQKTFEKMKPDQKYLAKGLIEKGRALAPFVQPVMKETKRSYSFANPSLEQYAEHVRMEPRIDIRTSREVERLAKELNNLAS